LRRIAIVGCGLIGGSIALAVRQRLSGTDLITLDRGDEVAPAADADLIVLATPVGEIIGLLGALRPIVPPATLITDTGSTKTAIVAAAEGLRFIGGHPIAGAATGGRASARADLFDTRPWVLTPGADASPDDLERLRAFVQQLGATPHIAAADEHDRLFAFLSHLPQLVATALLDVVGSTVGAEGLALSGTGLRDTTRLAGSPADIWRDILRTNGDSVTEAIDALIETLSRLRDDRDGRALEATFDRARQWRAALDATRQVGPI
jgi:prephenate dehydrogenase